MSEKRFKNYTLIIVITILLSLISVLPLGILGLITTALLASVIGYTVTKFHYWFVAFVCVCSTAVTALFVWDLAAAVSYVLPTLLCGLSLGIAHNIKLGNGKTITLVSCIYTLYLVLNISILGTNSKGQNIIEEALYSSAGIYKNALTTAYAGQISAAELDELMSVMLTTITKFIPGFIIIVCMCIALLYFWIFKKVLKIAKCDISAYKPFSAWRAEKAMSIIFIVITAISLVAPRQDYLSDALANAVMVSCFIFFIFGMSYLNFLLKRVMKNSALRKVVLIFITVSSVFTLGLPFIIVLMLGVLDSFVDFRKKSIKNNLPE